MFCGAGPRARDATLTITEKIVGEYNLKYKMKGLFQKGVWLQIQSSPSIWSYICSSQFSVLLDWKVQNAKDKIPNARCVSTADWGGFWFANAKQLLVKTSGSLFISNPLSGCSLFSDGAELHQKSNS